MGDGVNECCASSTSSARQRLLEYIRKQQWLPKTRPPSTRFAPVSPVPIVSLATPISPSPTLPTSPSSAELTTPSASPTSLSSSTVPSTHSTSRPPPPVSPTKSSSLTTSPS